MSDSGLSLAVNNVLLRELLNCASFLPLRLIEQNGKPTEAKPMTMTDLTNMRGTKAEVKILLRFNRNRKFLATQARARSLWGSLAGTWEPVGRLHRVETTLFSSCAANPYFGVVKVA